ncbi:hypothetical protein HUT18_18330 [Streptomyces sp. NA04227]|uniref:hypothetical protein n=1 Tax=Streptomyces sp. NA04227 TaxID=2742136 RepID=UPI00159154A4|nr:hypothetical protein [Streptomyces sp. NA04227]QKW08045.1 hypothetical protein HUT18_18330 [Streptomyces sp. NA04227]
MPYEITAPDQVEGIVAGVAFTAGRAVVDEPAAGALLYFRRHAFTVAALDTDPPASGEQTALDGPPGKRPAVRSGGRSNPGRGGAE